MTQLSAGDYGILGIFAVILASAVAVLFFRYEKLVKTSGKAQEEMAKERADWSHTREKLERELRLEFERKHRETVEDYAKKLREDREESRKYEAEARQEFAEMMEKIAQGQTRTSEQLVAMLQKFYDRFVGPAARSR